MENLFDKPVKRRGTGSLKWDVAENADVGCRHGF
mgnify:CR=1 FL=1